ncbi:MAG: methionyl-tRNA formyltransferase [Patescibacteria group bacterium]
MNIPFTYFGSSRFSVIVLDTLTQRGLVPTLIVTTPDKPQGRKMVLTPNVVKTWAVEHSIPVEIPEQFNNETIELLKRIASDVFIVASYGKILPSAVIDIPPHKTLNIHPSLLPQYRGASPLQSAMLEDTKNTGITIMRIDDKMDHGPLLAHKGISIDTWPTYEAFETLMATEGANLLADTLPLWIEGKITEQEQEHPSATFTKKIHKEDGLLDLTDDAYKNFRKIQAYNTWPVAYVMHTHNGTQIRVKITEASYTNNTLAIERVIPEGGTAMPYADFVRGYGALNASSR